MLFAYWWCDKQKYFYLHLFLPLRYSIPFFRRHKSAGHRLSFIQRYLHEQWSQSYFWEFLWVWEIGSKEWDFGTYGITALGQTRKIKQRLKKVSSQRGINMTRWEQRWSHVGDSWKPTGLWCSFIWTWHFSPTLMKWTLAWFHKLKVYYCLPLICWEMRSGKVFTLTNVSKDRESFRP